MKTVNFDLTQDQEMLKSLAERFVTDRYDVARRREYLDEPQGFDARGWQLLGEIGIIAAPFSADEGGLGLDAMGIAVIHEALGHGLAVEPLIESVLTAGRLFAALASPQQRNRWLDSVVSGQARLSLAHAERGSRNGSVYVATSAQERAGQTVLSGQKPFAISGYGADAHIVSARHDGAPADSTGWAFYLVMADAAGVEATPWRLADGSRAALLKFDEVAAEPLGSAQQAPLALANAERLASLARSAEALGIMERMFSDTLDYLRTREQFGQPLGKFQAIQHRMAAQYAVLTQARALVELAVVKQGEAGFARAVHGARAFVAGHSLELGHEMIQFHGGMGVTDELALGFAHKRLLVLSRWPDDAGNTLDSYIDS
ncbi:acyl-CoA dehydrogenase family protein [Croceicoccus sp. F390]|uniref:Acyl-CoA dehydrogenase family protein n=1 Tax=Croceicoccus esteveae TaxID=3075597 RepID=A0ABU2ZKQ5_9SPHN|nr:acyl-CoA dehydrogenase family protein [Croceicoccus sp. F390]MDT0576002.1 acyl-CoA dehydrogenase family protein [Croceicoccus sp. F390]